MRTNHNRGLAKIDSPEARQRLLRAALDSPRAGIRVAAADSLAEPESAATSAVDSAVLEHTALTRVEDPGVPNPHLLAPLLAALERPESQGTPAVLR